MFSRIKGGHGIAPDQAVPGANDVQSLRLELDERDRQIRTLSADLDFERTGRADEVEAVARARLRALMSSIAPALVQLELQRSLAASGVNVGARDVLLVAGRLIGSLNDAGLEILGTPGQELTFDEASQASLDPSFRPSAGSRVRVRIPGARVEGMMLVKICVDRVDAQ